LKRMGYRECGGSRPAGGVSADRSHAGPSVTGMNFVPRPFAHARTRQKLPTALASL